MSAQHNDPWPFYFTPWNWIQDGRDNDDVCSVCLERCDEEDIEAIVDTNGTQHFACPECYDAIRNDLEEQ